MSTQAPKAVKSGLKFKSTTTTHKKTTVTMPPKNDNQVPVTELKQQQIVRQEEVEEREEKDGKTPAEKAFEIARKTRMIHKQSERGQLTMQERLAKRSKILSKLPDHEDLFKTGEKIQKGY